MSLCYNVTKLHCLSTICWQVLNTSIIGNYALTHLNSYWAHHRTEYLGSSGLSPLNFIAPRWGDPTGTDQFWLVSKKLHQLLVLPDPQPWWEPLCSLTSTTDGFPLKSPCDAQETGGLQSHFPAKTTPQVITEMLVKQTRIFILVCLTRIKNHSYEE